MSSTASKRKVKKRATKTSKKPRRAIALSSAESKAEGRTPHISTAETLFEDIGFTKEEARLLTIKSELHIQILRLVRERGYTQKDLSRIWSKPQPRVSEILNGKISLFSIDTLVTHLGQLGTDIRFSVQETG